MTRTLIVLTLILSIYTTFGSNENTGNNRNSGLKEVESGAMDFSNNVDSLLNLWFMQQYSITDDSGFVVSEFTDSIIPEFPDSVYIQRINDLNSCINLSFNRTVRNYINLYTQKKRDLVQGMLGLQEYYFPFFEEVLDANQMPLELKYLPVIESALNPNAVSRAGATGLWQFMYGTGRLYKLEINTWVDDRRDPVKATYAAVAFMKDLYSIYHDWVLVIAAYNCGPANVNKAIRRSGGKRDYWEIYYHLPRETRGYVPAFIAANYVMNYYKEHNLTAIKPELPMIVDTLMINEPLHLRQVSDVINIPMDVLHKINPQYRLDIIPAKEKSYALRLPIEYIAKFIDNEDSIYTYKDSVFFDPNIINRTPSRYHDYIPTPPSKDHAKVTYTVKSGDNLGYISMWFNVKIDDLRYWNHVRRNVIREGQRLTVFVPKSKVNYYREFDNMGFDEKRKITGKPSVAPVQQTSVQPETGQLGEFVYYTVKRGDTIWEIAQRFPGVTKEEILNINNLENANSIYPGQKLKIRKKS